MILINRTCERCGANAKEAPLTRSHTPRQSLAKYLGLSKSIFRVHVLCLMCHKVYTKIEDQVIMEACLTMKLKHAQYVNQK